MRKTPRQARSRALVDRLIDATGRVIAQRGLAFTTTNHIAAEAGVDIASLYQYFRHKEELIEAWLDRLADDLIQLATDYLAGRDLAQTPLRELLAGALSTGIAALRANPVVMELARDWGHLSIHRPMMILEQELLRVAMIYFHHRGQVPPDLHVRLFVLANSLMATAGRHLSEARPLFSDQALVDCLVEMSMRLLEAPPASTQRQ